MPSGGAKARQQESFEYSGDERDAAIAIARTALEEDLGSDGDITTVAFVDLAGSTQVEGRFAPRSRGVLAGTLAAGEVFRRFESALVEWHACDGDGLEPGLAAGVVRGAATDVLAGERSALNLLCHLSGVATLAAEFVSRISEVAPDCRLRDTRKTLPGMRVLEKAAVRAGGGINHRIGLSDGVLIKDNHLAAFGLLPQDAPALELSEAEREGLLAGKLGEVVALIRGAHPGVRIEIEADTLSQVDAAVASGADVVLCDNMSPAELRQAVALSRGRCKVEASGGITLDNVAEIAAAGVDYVAVGAVTHSAPSLDIGLDIPAGTGRGRDGD